MVCVVEEVWSDSRRRVSYSVGAPAMSTIIFDHREEGGKKEEGAIVLFLLDQGRHSPRTDRVVVQSRRIYVFFIVRKETRKKEEESGLLSLIRTALSTKRKSSNRVS